MALRRQHIQNQGGPHPTNDSILYRVPAGQEKGNRARVVPCVSAEQAGDEGCRGTCAGGRRGGRVCLGDPPALLGDGGGERGRSLCLASLGLPPPCLLSLFSRPLIPDPPIALHTSHVTRFVLTRVFLSRPFTRTAHHHSSRSFSLVSRRGLYDDYSCCHKTCA